MNETEAFITQLCSTIPPLDEKIPAASSLLAGGGGGGGGGGGEVAHFENDTASEQEPRGA